MTLVAREICRGGFAHAAGADRSRRSRRSHRPPISARYRGIDRNRRRSAPIPSAMPPTVPSWELCIAIRTACCSRRWQAARSIAASVFAAKRSAREKPTRLSPADFERAYAYIAAHPEIWEVILTGGDPFILSRRAAPRKSPAALPPSAMSKIIRWHTRVPMVDPGRVSDDFVAALWRRASPAGWRSMPIIPGNFHRTPRRRWRGWWMRAFPWSASRCC